jgi:hypothetical protein
VSQQPLTLVQNFTSNNSNPRRRKDRNGSSAESRILRFPKDGGGLPIAATPISEFHFQ